MFAAGALTFREFAMHEPLPLAVVQEAVLEFLRDRDDAVVFGAQAVNAYVNEPRMSQDIDLVSSRAGELARELRDALNRKFHIAVRIREVGEGRGYRVFQTRESGSRHLVGIRPVETLPSAQRIGGVLVMAPADLIASKVIAYHARRGRPKSGSDWRDLAMLLLRFPEFKRDPELVAERLRASNVDPAVLVTWTDFASQDIQPENEDDGF
jgi:hypothetical protein